MVHYLRQNFKDYIFHFYIDIVENIIYCNRFLITSFPDLYETKEGIVSEYNPITNVYFEYSDEEDFEYEKFNPEYIENIDMDRPCELSWDTKPLRNYCREIYNRFIREQNLKTILDT